MYIYVHIIKICENIRKCTEVYRSIPEGKVKGKPKYTEIYRNKETDTSIYRNLPTISTRAEIYQNIQK